MEATIDLGLYTSSIAGNVIHDSHAGDDNSTNEPANANSMDRTFTLRSRSQQEASAIVV